MARNFAMALAVAGGILILSAAPTMAGHGGHSGSMHSGGTMNSEMGAPAGKDTDSPSSPEMKSPGESMGTQEEPGKSDTMKSGHEMEPAVETGAPPEDHKEYETKDPAATE